MKILIAAMILCSTQVSIAKATKSKKTRNKCEQCVVEYRNCRTQAKSNEFPVSATAKCELTYTECSEEHNCN